MEKKVVIEKMNLRDSYLIKKREAQKNREADEFIMSIEMNISKINNELRGLTEANYGWSSNNSIKNWEFYNCKDCIINTKKYEMSINIVFFGNI